jgi:hypothetical protein
VLPAPVVPTAGVSAPAKSKRRVRLALFVAVFALVLTACSVNNEPKDYNDAVQANFITACKDANPDKKDVPDAAQFCQCTYDAIKSSYKFAEFKALDSKLRDALANKDTAPKNADDIAKLDPGYATAVGGCKTAGPSAPASATTTAVVTTTSK